ncbi:hypothetical protein AFLA70_521g000711, partial [Aspergillus flavus AF70]
SNNTNHLVIRNNKGPATALYIDDQAVKPSPGNGEVLVQVKAFGLNRMDIAQREGRYPVPPQAGPVLGVEFSGIVDELGDGCDPETCKIGDEVFGLVYGGAYAEYVRVSQRMVIPKPAEWSWEFAAAIPETWMTATQTLHEVAKIQPGNSILWHAGASAVSIAGIQMSVAAGASAVYATVGTDEKVVFTQSIGAAESFNYRTQDWSSGIKAATGHRGVDIIVDFVGKDYLGKNLNTVAKDGRIVVLALMSGSVVSESVDIAPILRKRATISGSNLRGRDLDYQVKIKEELVNWVIPRMRKGEFQVPIESVFSFTEVVEAHQLMESNATKGKIICTIG